MGNIYSYIAYPAGFSAGILIGMLIEERLAFGKVVVRIISSQNLEDLVDYLEVRNIRYSMVSAEGKTGHEKLLFSVIKRDHLPKYLDEVQKSVPKAFYTIESVKRASETGMSIEPPSKKGLGAWLTSVKRK